MNKLHLTQEVPDPENNSVFRRVLGEEAHTFSLLLLFPKHLSVATAETEDWPNGPLI